ncbi:solute carrier family 2, facilitated glucose transporter member 1 isoform X3 [Folsomia candida]|uniref:solute carrier family 2, facilitated glucose transporter member 1 isoform X3 n=1 Tax=Folsomia candida TaxID=158441 RepID=UPI000B903B62|nr:solute carrier family 2, facilitated glucose transporter member 1 isoform X3 [Folsomia candida]
MEHNEKVPLLPRRPSPQIGVTGKLALAIAAAAFGSSFQHGYNTGVVNAPQALISQFINETNFARTGEYMEESRITFIWSWTVSIFCVGGIVGALLTGLIADKLGRKNGLLWNNVPVLIAVILEGFSKSCGSYEMLIAGRFFIGFNSGLNAGLAPMYLAEISPMHLRGAVGTMYQLVVTISILVSQILGLESLLGTENKWPWLLAATIIPAFFQICTLPLCPESPKFTLLNQGKEIEAQRALTWLRGTIEVHDELDEMRAEYEQMKSMPTVTLKEMLCSPALRMPLIIACMMMLAQQLSGINAVIFFSTKIFTSAGLDENTARVATLGMGTCNVIMTVVSLVMVEKAGRKTLMLFGLSGMCVDVILLFFCIQFKEIGWVSYVSIFLVIFFVVMFASGPGSIPWFLVSELFSQGARPMATSIAVAVNWIANFVVGLSFLPLLGLVDAYVFIIFAGLLGFFIVFTYFKVPETKGKTVEEISALFRQRGYTQG